MFDILSQTDCPAMAVAQQSVAQGKSNLVGMALKGPVNVKGRQGDGLQNKFFPSTKREWKKSPAEAGEWGPQILKNRMQKVTPSLHDGGGGCFRP